MPRRRHFALLFALPFLLGGRADLDGQAAPRPRIDREYRLQATMLGYRGIGGSIAGIRNPTLWARTGETVRITIVNGEVMVHDIALEKQPVKSRQILERGETASITFTAEASDTYYCSLPGHRISGMEGRLDVSDEPRTTADEGSPPTAGQRSLNFDFEGGTLSDWTATGDAFSHPLGRQEGDLIEMRRYGHGDGFRRGCGDQGRIRQDSSLGNARKIRRLP